MKLTIPEHPHVILGFCRCPPEPTGARQTPANLNLDARRRMSPSNIKKNYIDISLDTIFIGL